ncbi:unnamed protein product [Alternaria alternata]
MPKRMEEDEAEWESRREAILNLYLHQDRPLHDVIQMLADQGFQRTTPPGIELSTPPSTPLAEDVELTDEQEKHMGSLQVADKAIVLDAEDIQLPEHTDAPLIRQLDISASTVHVSTAISNPNSASETWLRVVTSPSPQFTEPWTKPFLFSKPAYDSSREMTFSRQTVAPPDTSLQTQVCLSQRHSIPKLASHVHPLLHYVLSIQTNTEEILNNLTRRTKDNDHTLFLQSLLVSQTLDTELKHFAQKFLVEATIAGDLPLVERLVGVGVDINARSAQGGDMEVLREVTALQMAVYNRREDLIKYLLCHGADDWRARYRGANGWVEGSVLDIVMEMGSQSEWRVEDPGQNDMISSSILEVLLTFRSRTKDQPVRILLRATRLAVLRNRMDLVRILFRHYPALLEEARSEPWLLLEAAATTDSVTMFETLISMGLDVNSTDLRGYGSVMASAAQHSNMQLITYPLQIAAWNGHAGIARMLIDHYADVNAKSSEDALLLPALDSKRTPIWSSVPKHQTPIRIAFERDHPKVFKVLSENGATMVASYSDEGLAVLCDAIVQGNTKLAEHLLIEGASKLSRHTIREGSRALVLAVRHENSSMIDILLRAGFCPYDTVDPESEGLEDLDDRHMFFTRESPFEVALEHQKTDPLRKFLAFSPEVLDKEQRTARYRQLSAAYASALCSENSILENAILLETDLNPDKIDRIMGVNYVEQRLHFALQHAAMSKRYAKVERLLDAGAMPNSPNTFTADVGRIWTPLQYAATHDNVSIVKKLIAAGANVNAPAAFIDGMTALQSAAINGNSEMLELLIKAGANVNAPPGGYNGRTALEGAAEAGKYDIAVYLLITGADIRGRDNLNYRRTIYRAWKNGCIELADMAQEWKITQYGPQDCKKITEVVESITSEELDFASGDAMREYSSQMLDYDSEEEEDNVEFSAED